MNYKPIALGLLIATCWSPAVADSPSARLPQEPQTIELVNGSRIRYSLPTDAALLITVENQNRGAIVSVLDDDDNTLFRSANWRGIEGQFVTAVLPNEAAAIEITPDTAIAPDGTFSIWSNKIDKRNPLFQAERAMTLAADASLAQYYGRGNESEQTVSYLTDAIARFEQLGTVERLADAHYELAVAQQALQDTRARRSFENAHSYFVMSDDRPGQAAVRNMQGVDAWQQSRYADALELLRQAEELRAGGSDYYLAHALNNRALVHRDLNQPAIAARLLKRSIQLWQGDIDLLGDPIPTQVERDRFRNTSLTQAINAMTNLGWAYEASDQLENAEHVLNQALRLSTLLDRERPAADARNNLASVHYRKGEFEFALAHISAALEHFEQNEGDKDRISNAYELRSQIYRMTGETPLAKRDLQRALTLRPIDKRPLRHAETLRMLASLSLEDESADFDLVTTSQQIRDITSGVPGGDIIAAETQAELGRWYATQGDTKRGIEEIQSAIADIDSAATSRKLRLAHALADALLRDRQFEASLEELEHILADALIQDSPVLRSESLVTQSQALLGLNRLADAQRSAESALAISESTRSQLNDPVLLRSYARMQRAAYETLIEVAILSDEHERAWLLAQRARSRRINELIANTGSPSLPAVQPSIVELRRSIDADAVIAQYFLGVNTSHAWFLSKTGLTHRRLTSAKVLSDLVYDVRESISARRAISADTLNQLSRSLLPENLPNELLLMPDGALYDLPFSILTHSELPTGEPLIAHASTRVLPTNWQPGAGNRLGDDARVTEFADPIFSADDQRFAGADLLHSQDPILALI